MEEEGKWADLAPELLAIVAKKVQSQSDEDHKESRRAVAMAGVCRSWRKQVLLVDAQYARTSLLQFPDALVRPPRIRGDPVQCLLKRKGSLFLLFQTKQQDDDEEEEEAEEDRRHHHFVLAARRRWLPTGFSYVIGIDPRNVWSKQGPGVLGKLKSNFWASEFVLWEKEDVLRSAATASAGTTRPVVSLRFMEHIVNGIRQRRIWCALPPPCTGLGLSCVADKRKSSGLRSRLLSSPCLSWSSSCVKHSSGLPAIKVDAATASSRLRMLQTGIAGATCAVSRGSESQNHHYQQGPEPHDDDGESELRSKVPAWDAQQQCWSLDFKGRATMPSMHNFQLIRAEEHEDHERQRQQSQEQNDQEQQQNQQQSGTVVLQLGKIGKNSYTMDFCYPLSAFQAFAICLSSFATSAGLEP